MNKLMMILSVWGLMFSQLIAEDTRIAVRDEILKAFDAVEQARQDAINELRDTVKSVEDARAMRAGEQQSIEISQTKIVESQAVSNIETVKANAVQSIVEAVSSVEIAKARAVKSIVEAVGKVELSKIHSEHKYINDTSAITVSKNISVVETSRAVATVETVKVLKPSDIHKMNSQQYKIKSGYPTKFIRFYAK